VKQSAILLTTRRQLRTIQKATENIANNTEQDAQLSQRDRAAGCIIVFAKSRRLKLEDNISRTL